jgi:hypothetical protein
MTENNQTLYNNSRVHFYLMGVGEENALFISATNKGKLEEL